MTTLPGVKSTYEFIPIIGFVFLFRDAGNDYFAFQIWNTKSFCWLGTIYSWRAVGGYATGWTSLVLHKLPRQYRQQT